MAHAQTFVRVDAGAAPAGGKGAAPADVFGAALDTLRLAAPAEDAGTADIGGSVAILRAAGLATDDGTADPALTARRLMRIGAANLPVGRLWEGHVNALYLVGIHGGHDMLAEVVAAVSKGAFLGVWGADGPKPVRWDPGAAALRGSKSFASGLGVVTDAVITVNTGPDVRLALVDVRDAARADASVWRMRGMRATASGAYDLDGVPESALSWIGAPGAYLEEPHFVGGVWRIAALQVGAAIGLLEATAARLRALGRLNAPAQMSRITTALIHSMAASALVSRAAVAASADAGSAERSVSLSAAARLLTEEVGLDAIRAAEQCLGMAHFQEDAETDRMSRDLAVYMRQAARDAFLSRIGSAAFAEGGELWGLL